MKKQKVVESDIDTKIIIIVKKAMSVYITLIPNDKIWQLAANSPRL